jgi:hypothetical protein
VRIIRCGSRSRLANKTVPKSLIRCQRRRENLERYLPLKPLVRSTEYDGHSSLADLLLQAVSGYPRASRETAGKPCSVPLVSHRGSRI